MNAEVESVDVVETAGHCCGRSCIHFELIGLDEGRAVVEVVG